MFIKDLTTGYSDNIVSQNLTATLESGSLTCLLGPNGCGKSTLLRTLAGFQKALSGEIEIEGREISEYSPQELAMRVGIVLTGRPDTPMLTVEETVEMGRAPYTGFWGFSGHEDKRIIEKAISMVGVTHLRERRLSTLSDGECQKVMIAKTLAQQTPIILLDEPTAFIDYPGKVELLRLLGQLAHEENKTIFISTHDLEIALRLTDNVWLLDKTNGLTTTTPGDAIDNKLITKYFPQYEQCCQKNNEKT